MLEKVDLQKTVDKETYRQVSEELGERLAFAETMQGRKDPGNNRL